MKQKITIKKLNELKKKYGFNDTYPNGEKIFKSNQDFIAWYDRNHGIGYGIEIVYKS